MQLQKVTSNTVEALGYDATLQQLHVLFKDNTYYKYDNVKFSTYQALLAAQSKGAFINRLGKITKGIKQ